MADPQISNVVRAQCIWKGASGLPTDRYVTSWAFVRASSGLKDGELQAGEVRNRLMEFWLTDAEGVEPVASFLPNSITERGLEIRTYDLGQPTSEGNEREPVISQNEVPIGSPDARLPEEVAVCLSFYADRNLPRRRGRVFIGPLTTKAMGTGSQAGRPDEMFLNALIVAGRRLSSAGMGIGDEMQWGVLSQMDEEIRPVTHGWADNAWDTMRSRGVDPNARATFTPSGPTGA